MRKRKIKAFVLPSIYVLIILVSFFSISLFNSYLFKDLSNQNYSKSLMKEDTKTVLKEEEKKEEKTFSRPYNSENVTLKTSFYSKDTDQTTQINSLLSYENTYMPSTGCMYESDEQFDVLAMSDGTVTKVSKDEVLGNVIEITHNANLLSYYYSVDDILVEENALVSEGNSIGKSSTNKLSTEKSSVYVEVYYQGLLINPEDFYNMNPNEMQ